MFKSRAENGKNNRCGDTVARLRTEMHISQRELAEKLQLAGMDVDKNAVQRIEAGKRFVTDIELAALRQVLGCTLDELVGIE